MEEGMELWRGIIGGEAALMSRTLLPLLLPHMFMDTERRVLGMRELELASFNGAVVDIMDASGME